MYSPRVLRLGYCQGLGAQTSLVANPLQVLLGNVGGAPPGELGMAARYADVTLGVTNQLTSGEGSVAKSEARTREAGTGAGLGGATNGVDAAGFGHGDITHYDSSFRITHGKVSRVIRTTA